MFGHAWRDVWTGTVRRACPHDPWRDVWTRTVRRARPHDPCTRPIQRACDGPHPACACLRMLAHGRAWSRMLAHGRAWSRMVVPRAVSSLGEAQGRASECACPRSPECACPRSRKVALARPRSLSQIALTTIALPGKFDLWMSLLGGSAGRRFQGWCVANKLDFVERRDGPAIPLGATRRSHLRPWAERARRAPGPPQEQ